RLDPSKAALLSVALLSTVFCIDLSLQLGVASAVPYTFAVLLALKARSKWFAPAIAALCITLTMVKVVVHPDRGTSELWKVLANRGLAVFAIAMTLLLGLLTRRAERRRLLAEEETRRHLLALAHLSRVKTAGQLATGLAHEL